MYRIDFNRPMPESCSVCPMCDDYMYCTGKGKSFGKANDWIMETRAEWCPLVEVKDEKNVLEKIAKYLGERYEPPVIPGEKTPLTDTERTEVWTEILSYIGGK